jgi:autotransporter-associated beta strand protein
LNVSEWIGVFRAYENGLIFLYPLDQVRPSFFKCAELGLSLRVAAFCGALAFGCEASAQTSLNVGDIQVTGVTADAADSFSFVLWKDIASGTVIRFMDHSFTNATTGLNGSESDMSLTFGTGLSAGTVVYVEDGGVTRVNGGTFVGTKSGSLSSIAGRGDQVFVYQGTAVGAGTSFAGRTLLYGFNVADTSWLSSGAANSRNSYLPTAINSLDANVDTGNFDNADYSGARTGMTTAAYRAAVGNLVNYTQSNTRFALNTGGFTSVTGVNLTWDANGTSAGTGGAGTWDTTTQSQFKNGSSGATYLHWVNSSSGNAHTAVFGGTAGAVNVAAGGVIASGLSFDVNGYSITGNSVTLTGATPAVSVTNAADAATITSTLSGSAGITKGGAGLLVLAGNNNYTGATTLSSGVLQVGSSGVGNTGTGAMNVSGGTLTGTGTVRASSVTFSNGTRLAAGDVTGLGVTGKGTLTFTPITTAIYDIASDAEVLLDVTPGGVSDKLVFNGTTGSSLTWNGRLKVGAAVLTPTAPEMFDLVDWSSPVVPTFAAHFSSGLLRDGSADNGTEFDLPDISGTGYAWDLSAFTSSGVVSIVAVPEPKGGLYAWMGALVFSVRRRRKGWH